VTGICFVSSSSTLSFTWGLRTIQVVKTFNFKAVNKLLENDGNKGI